MSTTNPSNKNLLPALVNSNMLTNTLPTASNVFCTKETFSTPIAINN